MPLRPTLLRAARVRTTLKKLGITALKIDIEGAEAVVFGKASSSWLDMVDMIAVELHDDLIFGNATDIFLNAVKSQGFGFFAQWRTYDLQTEIAFITAARRLSSFLA